MKYYVMTLFPEIISNSTNHSILKRAKDNNFIDIIPINIRDYSNNKHKKVDDYPFGGGSGMVMSAEPIINCYEDIKKDIKGKSKVIYLSPSGKVFTQNKAKRLSNLDNIIFLCGHYEGVDQRAIDYIVDEEISIGDYVLTGGEVPSIVVMEAVSRLLPGVLSNENSSEDESFSNGLLEYPQYTRPREIKNMKVPDVLLNGNHFEIEKWRFIESIKKTFKNRKDLIKKRYFDNEKWEKIKKVLQNIQ